MEKLSDNQESAYVDPLNLEELKAFRLMNKTIFGKYQRSWIHFCGKYGISKDREPEEANYLDFFKHLHAAGYCYASLRTVYSHLNKAVDQLYGYKLQRYSRITSFLKGTNKKETGKGRGVFKKEDLDLYLTRIDTSNRYLLVRAVVAVVSYCGGHRPDKLKRLRFGDVKRCQEGFRVGFTLPKEGVLQQGQYLIPKKPPGAVGYDYASLMQTYLDAIIKEVAPRGDETLLWSGRRDQKAGSYRFVKHPLGINEIRRTGKAIANFLGLKNPEVYGYSYCFRIQGDAKMLDVDAGGSGQQEEAVSEYSNASSTTAAESNPEGYDDIQEFVKLEPGVWGPQHHEESSPPKIIKTSGFGDVGGAECRDPLRMDEGAGQAAPLRPTSELPPSGAKSQFHSNQSSCRNAECRANEALMRQRTKLLEKEVKRLKRVCIAQQDTMRNFIDSSVQDLEESD